MLLLELVSSEDPEDEVEDDWAAANGTPRAMTRADRDRSLVFILIFRFLVLRMVVFTNGTTLAGLLLACHGAERRMLGRSAAGPGT